MAARNTTSLLPSELHDQLKRRANGIAKTIALLEEVGKHLPEEGPERAVAQGAIDSLRRAERPIRGYVYASNPDVHAMLGGQDSVDGNAADE